jgi:tetratricopeptide (TPR) repeat protein
MSLVSKNIKFKILDISNMNKRYISLIIAVLATLGNAFSQDKELQKADKYFNQFNYSMAIEKYLNLISENQNTYYATIKIAECYSKMQQTEKAIKWYLKAIKFPDFDYHIYYRLAQELKKINEYDAAQDYMQKYLELSGSKPKGYDYPMNNYIRLLKEDSTRYEIYKLKINSEYSEFGPVIYKNSLIYSSNRPKRTWIKRDDVMTGRPFYSLYIAKVASITELKDPKPFAGKFNSKLNIGPVCFNKEQNIMYVTQNSIKNKQDGSVLDIYTTKKTKGKWSKNLERIPLQHTGYSIAHPSLSPDGRKLYFSSDMPGGYGGMDLYVCDNKNGFLSTPENLGPDINTPGNEVFPFMASDGRLYFASDGLQGLGGFDIFFVLPAETSFSYPFNMGYPINTAADDFSFYLNSDNRTGYLTSNRPGGRGEDDIYSFRIMKQLDYCLLVGTIVDEETRKPLNGVQIVIKNNMGVIVYKLVSDPNGGFSIYLKKDKNYIFTCRKKLYKQLNGKFTDVQMMNKKILQLELNMQPK